MRSIILKETDFGGRKPNVKPNRERDGDISSEEERKQVEDSMKSEEERFGFKLDKSCLEKLKERDIPIKVLTALEKLKEKKWSKEEDFLSSLESVLGADLTKQYRSQLSQYARYKKRTRQKKVPEIHIDREETCYVDKTKLPQDAEFRGLEDKTVQDLIIKTDNVHFKREVYYSPSRKKTYLAPVPEGYCLHSRLEAGEYGPHLNSHLVSMKYVNGMSIPKIKEFLNNFGTIISSSYISHRLTKKLDVFHREKEEIVQAGLECGEYLQIDDTGSRVNGKNHYTQIICNPFFTAFFTTERKDRLTILDILRRFESREFILNEEAFELLINRLWRQVPQKLIQSLGQQRKQNRTFNEEEIEKIIDAILPDPNKGATHRVRIKEACAIACYHQEISTLCLQSRSKF